MSLKPKSKYIFIGLSILALTWVFWWAIATDRPTKYPVLEAIETQKVLMVGFVKNRTREKVDSEHHDFVKEITERLVDCAAHRGLFQSESHITHGEAIRQIQNNVPHCARKIEEMTRYNGVARRNARWGMKISIPEIMLGNSAGHKLDYLFEDYQGISPSPPDECAHSIIIAAIDMKGFALSSLGISSGLPGVSLSGQFSSRDPKEVLIPKKCPSLGI